MAVHSRPNRSISTALAAITDTFGADRVASVIYDPATGRLEATFFQQHQAATAPAQPLLTAVNDSDLALARAAIDAANKAALAEALSDADLALDPPMGMLAATSGAG